MNKAQSQIISTILLILLVLTAFTIIIAFVIPFVEERLESGNCLDVAGKIEISSGYTCFNDAVDPDEMQVQIQILDIKDLINGFAIELGGASTDSFKIEGGIDGTTIDTKMCDQTTDLEIPPEDNTQRTYAISVNTKPETIKVYPILKNGRLCEASDIVTEVDNCISNQCTTPP